MTVAVAGFHTIGLETYKRISFFLNECPIICFVFDVYFNQDISRNNESTILGLLEAMAQSRETKKSLWEVIKMRNCRSERN
jgi:hypothetical protein